MEYSALPCLAAGTGGQYRFRRELASRARSRAGVTCAEHRSPCARLGPGMPAHLERLAALGASAAPRRAQRRALRRQPRSRTRVSLCWSGIQVGGGGTDVAPPTASPSACASIGRGDCGSFERGFCDFRDGFSMSRFYRVCRLRPGNMCQYRALPIGTGRPYRSGHRSGLDSSSRSRLPFAIIRGSAASAASAVADERLVVLLGDPGRRRRDWIGGAAGFGKRRLVDRARRPQ